MAADDYRLEPNEPASELESTARNEATATALAPVRGERPTWQRSTRVSVAHVAEFSRRYPGEPLTYYTRVQVNEDLATAVLEILAPGGLRFVDAVCTSGDLGGPTDVRAINEDVYIFWHIERPIDRGAEFEFAVHTVVEPADYDVTIDSSAVLTARSRENGDLISDEEWVRIPVRAKGAYLRYLPAIFTRDEMMGRFLMLFESFWAPISNQIAHIDRYFDPTTAPADMLPWLASWLDLVLDEEWPEDRRRALLKSARRLYQKRGTRVGLQEYLEVYTGGEVQIIEHKAGNFRLRDQATLGSGIALGRENRPHTFSVIVRLPPDRLGSPPAPTEPALRRWRRTIAEIIDKEKPAHTAYTLHVELLESPEK